MVRAESRYPFGLFRAWTIWRPAGEQWVYPRPESPPPPWPQTDAARGDDSQATRTGSGTEFEGVRAYRRGDTLRQVVWKKAARTGEMISRETAGAVQRQMWLQWGQAQGLDTEARLSRLAAWVMAADAAGHAWGLACPAPSWRRPAARPIVTRRCRRWRAGELHGSHDDTERQRRRPRAPALARAAARGPRHAVHGGADRLDDRAASVQPAAVGGRDDGRVLAWRSWLAWRQAPLPGRAAVLTLLGLAAVLTFTAQRTVVSKDAGVTLLVVLMALKTLELRARRDALVVFFLGFFLVLTTFLYSQSFLTALGTGVSVWGWLTALTLAHIPAGRPTIRQAGALAGRAALIGTPVMIALFLLFPRIGATVAVCRDGSRTGLSDHLELGSVADLANDDSIAFRIRFDGPVPAAAQMYFRGPVLVDTDGRDWHAQSLLDGRLAAWRRRSPSASRTTAGARPTSSRWSRRSSPGCRCWS